ncbi:PUA domain-containing protein [Algoriphagus boritolerans]|uniref:PUA domain-containing protein n=1 Tax=Algoriphagus boritolerans TaxID=308111 RepID=UPI002FCE274B
MTECWINLPPRHYAARGLNRRRSKMHQKKWLAHGAQYYKGEVTISEGAKNSLTSAVIRSLLPVGITKIAGEFSKGDILLICDELGKKNRAWKSRIFLQKCVGAIGTQESKSLDSLRLPLPFRS